ncbi:MAG: hypothetical protein IJI48_04175 [Ruminococcus sp.]|nr:hypothetical protein [Ruminococcus sp.]
MAVIHLPENLSSIGSAAFSMCSNLATINWPAGLTSPYI